jgi:putative colanic acid biosynthesis UDP-glucose lipid carrier transferase
LSFADSRDSFVTTDVFDLLTVRRARAAPAPARSWRKRTLDCLLAFSAVLLFLPLFILVALAIRLDDGGPVLFVQPRTGLHGRLFTILKFRTMRTSGDGPTIRQACRNDARVTRVGRLLRKLSIDELPQLINVLRGDMSIVGPRPHALAHDAAWRLLAPGYEDRFAVRPGLTGLAQVRGFRGEIADDDGLRMRIDADREYIETWSFTRDLWLMVRTAPLIVADPRAY